MIELAYFSSANPDLKPEDLTHIQRTASANNSKKNITGSLIYCNDEFVQILEGKRDNVQELYSKIKVDSRHTNVILLAENAIEIRNFSKWNMAFSNLNEESSKEVFLKNNILSLSNVIQKPTLALDLFWAMAKHLVS